MLSAHSTTSGSYNALIMIFLYKKANEVHTKHERPDAAV